MVLYFFFLILAFLPLIEGEVFGIARFLLLASCLPLTIVISKRKIVKDKIFTLFAVFLFFAVLSTIFSSVFARSFNTLLLYFVYFVYFVSARTFAREKKALFLNLLLIAILFSSLALCFLSFYLFIIKELPAFSSMNLIYANFGHNHLVDFLIFSFPLGLALFFKEKRGFKKALFLLLNLIFLIAFVLSFSRGGILMAALILFLFEYKRSSIKKSKLRDFFVLGAVFFLIFILFLSIIGPGLLDKEKMKFKDSFVLTKFFRQVPVGSRIEYWRQASLAFEKKPLLGWGLDNFRYLSKIYQSEPSSWSWYTHNHFLQMFVETGFFGGLSFLLLIAFLLLKGKAFRERVIVNEEFSLKIALLVSAIHSLFDYDWQFPSVFLLFWVIAGYLTKGKVEKTNNHLLPAVFLFLGFLLFAVASLELTSNLFLFFGNKSKREEGYQKAEILYQKSLRVWPYRLENWQPVIDFYQESDQKQKELSTLHQLVVFEPLDVKNFRSIANWYYENANRQQTEVYYQKAADLSPLGSLDIYLKLVDIWSGKEREDPGKIFQTLTRIETIKGNKCLLMCIGHENEKKILGLLKSLAESKDLFQLDKARQARVYFWLAVLTASRQEWDKNIAWLEKAVTLDNKKEYQEFLTNLKLLKQLKENFWKEDLEETKELAKKILAKEKNHAFHEKFYLVEVYSFLAETYFIEGNIDEVLVHWQKAKEICPWDDISYLGLVKVFKKRGELDKAEEILQECLRINDWSDECREILRSLTAL